MYIFTLAGIDLADLSCYCMLVKEPMLFEVLETLSWYRPQERIATIEGVVVTKISDGEVILTFEGAESRWMHPAGSSPTDP